MCTNKITGYANVCICICVHTVRQYILVSALGWQVYIKMAYNCSVSVSCEKTELQYVCFYIHVPTDFWLVHSFKATVFHILDETTCQIVQYVQ